MLASGKDRCALRTVASALRCYASLTLGSGTDLSGILMSAPGEDTCPLLRVASCKGCWLPYIGVCYEYVCLAHCGVGQSVCELLNMASWRGRLVYVLWRHERVHMRCSMLASGEGACDLLAFGVV